jgi:hypothetical protein
VQWHRFTDDSPLHPLLETVPYVAFKVNSLAEAIGEKQLFWGLMNLSMITGWRLLMTAVYRLN